MPYSNLPKSQWAKMDRCVSDVMQRSGLPKQRAIAVCHRSIASGKSIDELIEEEMNSKQRRKERRVEDRKLQRALEKQEKNETLTLDDMRALAEDEPLEETVSQEQAAAEIAAAINGKSAGDGPIPVTEPGDLLEFQRKMPTEVLAKPPKTIIAPEPQQKMEHYPEASHSNPDLPAGGATTFTELDEYREAMHEAQSIRHVTGDFEMLVGNVLAKSEPGELGDRIVALGEEMKNRLENPPEAKAIEQPAGIAAKIRGILEKAKLTRATKITQPAEAKSSGFRIEKALDGSYRWFGWVSNKFRDRDAPAEPKLGGQILSEAAHKEFVAWATAKPDRMPELWMWHAQDTAHSKTADWIDYADGFLVTSGPLTESEAERLKQLEGSYDLAMSHGLVNLDYDKANGVIRKYRTFEVSVLPRDHAANEWTDIETLQKEVADMGFTPQRRQFLVDAIGEEGVKKLEDETEQRGKALEALGVEYKEISETLERLEDDGDEEGNGDGPGESPIKAVNVDELAAAVAERLELKGLSEHLKAQGEAIVTMGKTLTVLAKTDDEKVAEQMRPRTDVESFIPIWSKRLSQSDETMVDPEKEKDLADSKPGLLKQGDNGWISEAMGGVQTESAAIPK